jgi:hypothetical protein
MSLKVPYSDFYSNHLSYDGSPCSFEVQIWGQNGSGLSWSFIFPTLERNRIVFTRSTARIFHLHFQLPHLPEETCFEQPGSSAVEVSSQAVLGSPDQRKVPASLSLFLKSEKIPALVCVGKGFEYRPFHDFQPVPSPTGLGHRSQILKGPELRPFSYTEIVVLMPTKVEQL